MSMLFQQEPHPPCPHCESENTLPFESDELQQEDSSIFFIMLTAFVLIAGYLAFVLASYLLFPLVVFTAIIVTTRVINKKQSRKREHSAVMSPKDYLCLDCSRFFKNTF